MTAPSLNQHRSTELVQIRRLRPLLEPRHLHHRLRPSSLRPEPLQYPHLALQPL